jgi:RNA polymerase sigma factor (sigma-70 family)
MLKLDPRLMKMALAMARQFYRRLPRSIVPSDIEQAALIGLLDGMRRHPDGEGPGWEWYLRCRIRGEILDELRRQDWSSRRRSGRATPKMRHLEDVNQQWQDFLPGDTESPEEVAITRIDAAKAWRAPVGMRADRILRATFERGRRQKDIGRDEGVSEARISQLIDRALAGMRRHLDEAAP